VGKNVRKISLLTWLALLLSIFFLYGCTKKVILNALLQPEPKEIAETDSMGNFISAEYCFHKSFENDSAWEWDFSPYKITNPLNFKLPEICEQGYSYSVGVDPKDSIDSKDSSVILGSLRGGGMGTIRANSGKQRKITSAYKRPVEEIFNIYPTKIDYIEVGIPLLQKEDTAKILNLAGKSFPVKWRFKFSCKREYVLDLQGTYYIRIYGICTEEQLKIIEYGEDNE